MAYADFKVEIKGMFKEQGRDSIQKVFRATEKEDAMEELYNQRMESRLTKKATKAEKPRDASE